MHTVGGLAVGSAPVDRANIEPRLGPFDRLERKKFLVLTIIVAIGFCARAYRLDAAGFAEDEANKLFAIRAYEQGDFTANAEHPMVMKMLCYASMHTATAWNRAAGNRLNLVLSDETALRLPNATFGALTVIPLLLLSAGLLGFRVGFITALLWSLGLDAIWFDRTAKEDTLLVFFMLWGFYLYYKAKQAPASHVCGRERLYSLAGGAFGLMMASKYFPQSFVIAPAVVTTSCLIHSYPSLYVNVFGGNRIGYFFPHDEYYDLGARESIKFIAETAPPGAMMASEIPGVVQYYLERFNRTDIRSQIISQPGFTLTEGRPDFVLLQPGRVYFENVENFRFIEKNCPIAQSSVYEGTSATRVYTTGDKESSAGTRVAPCSGSSKSLLQ